MREGDFMLAKGAPTGMKESEVDLSEWTFDLKLDGLRCIAVWDCWNVTLWSRSGRDITDKFPELALSASMAFSPRLARIVDGEILAKDGNFDTVAWREKQPAHAAGNNARLHPCVFYAFDSLDVGGNDVTGLAFIVRRQHLDALRDKNEHWDVVLSSKEPKFPAMVRELGMEGVIAKRDDSTYVGGLRSPLWLKFKNKHRVVCVSQEMTPGSGARERTFGALELIILANDVESGVTPAWVSCGKVGSGFTEQDLVKVGQLIRDYGSVVVEVECLGITKHGDLRQPVFKRVLDPQYITEARRTQFHDIPSTSS